ncbi:hypothetical protein [Halobacteriovorax sp. HLS]|uniref:hypothetical protein n=1 Tax=Halobacteriovorax sp. HLS TaxID=2234000 RepID=UPI000FD8A362|nr:hypothetical protein [Halobacteriovorax sp. HLS]
MKKHLLFLSIFALLTAASFEASIRVFKHATTVTIIDYSGLQKALSTISSTSMKELSQEVSQANSDKRISIIENNIITKNKMALRSFYFKKKSKKFTRKTNEENLARYVINSSELISLSAMRVPMIKTVAVVSMLNGFTLPVENPVFDQEIQLAKEVNKESGKEKPLKLIKKDVKQDVIKTAMSSTEKLNASEEAMINELVNNINIDKKVTKENKKVESEDDLLFFDYSEKKVEAPKKVNSIIEQKNTTPQIISMFQDAKKDIQETIKEERKQSDALKFLDNKLPKNKVTTQDNHQPQRQEVEKENDYPVIAQADPAVKALMSSQKKSNYPRNAKLTIKTSVGMIGKSLVANTSQFQFISDVSFGEPISSGSIGAIEIEEKINERVSTIRGTLLSSNTYPTIVELPLEYGDYLMNIPLLDRDDLFKRFEGLRGAMLLVELDENTDSIDIDHKYVERIYLSENFKEVDEASNYRFILFLGVEPGNTLIQYLTLNEEIGEKIVHLVEDHILYESNTFMESTKDKIELYETKVLGKKDLELDIDSDSMKFFNSGIKSKSVGLNLYEIDIPVMPLGMRKYLELSHMGETIYAGYQDNKAIHIPSKEYLNYVMDTFDISSLENQCMIQINFNKPIVDLTYASESLKGPIAFEVLYLDKDGMFNTDPSDFAKKIFLVGDTQGSVNIKVEYADNSKDYLQSFCSRNTFLVEQL